MSNKNKKNVSTPKTENKVPASVAVQSAKNSVTKQAVAATSAKKAAATDARKLPTKKDASSSSSSSESESESDSDDVSSDSSASELEEKSKPGLLKGKVIAKKEVSSSDEDSDASSSEDKSEVSSGDEDDEDDSAEDTSSEEEGDSDDDTSSEEDDSDEDASSDEENVDAKMKMDVVAKGASNKRKADTDSDSESEEDSDDASSSEEDDSENDDDEAKENHAAAWNKKAKTVDGSSVATDAPATCFIGNLSWNVDKDWLYEEFKECGKIVDVRIVTDAQSGRSKGFGYIQFASAEAASAALAMNGKEIDGRPVKIDNATTKTPSGDRSQRGGKRDFGNDRKGDFRPSERPTSPESNTLFVANLSFQATEESLRKAFTPYGQCNIRLPTDRESGRMKGFAYVEYNSINDAKSAFASCQGKEIEGRSVRLDFASVRAAGGDRNGGGRGGFGGDRRGGRGGFGGGGRGGRGGFGGDRRGGGRGGFGGAPQRAPQTAAFSGSKMTFDE